VKVCSRLHLHAYALAWKRGAGRSDGVPLTTRPGSRLTLILTLAFPEPSVGCLFDSFLAQRGEGGLI
jgi:hypothetical protein